jgi:hypothetical protein
VNTTRIDSLENYTAAQLAKNLTGAAGARPAQPAKNITGAAGRYPGPAKNHHRRSRTLGGPGQKNVHLGP